MENILSKDEFCKIIKQLKQISDFENNIRKEERELLKTLGDEYISDLNPSYSFLEPTIIEILNTMFCNTYDIGYFIYELNYGDKYEKGCVTEEIDGKTVDIDLSSPEKLYDWLVYELKNKLDKTEKK